MKYLVSVLPQEIQGFNYIKVIPKLNINQLSTKLEDDEATVLIAEYLLEYYPEKEQDAVLHMLASKTRLGGQLTVSIPNGKKILWNLIDLSFKNGNNTLYGDQDYPIRSMCFDIPAFLNKLQSLGFQVGQVLEAEGRNVFVCQKTR